LKWKSPPNSTSGLSGRAAVNLKDDQFVVDNGNDGFDVHELTTGKLLRTLNTGIPIHKYPKQVQYGENYGITVGGSDHGRVYIFDSENGRMMQTLVHDTSGLVQTVTVRKS
jgi:hypothetical protein